MWRRIKENFDAGREKVHWFSSLLNERLKVEISLFKLLHQSDEMEKKRAELLKSVGARLYALRHGPEKHILRDAAVQEAILGLERLEAEIEEVRKKASEIEKIEA